MALVVVGGDEESPVTHPELEAYCSAHGLLPTAFDATLTSALPRFIRVNSLERRLPTSSSGDVRSELPGLPVTWLCGLRCLDGSTGLKHTAGFSAGQFYGVDASSAAAVAVLDPQPGDRVLDLCCAPGAKLCLIAEAMAVEGAPRGNVVGVDISRDRLGAAATLMQRHGVVHTGSPQPGWRCQLYLGDGTSFRGGALPTVDLPCTGGGGDDDDGCLLVLDSGVENALRRAGRQYRGLPPPLCTSRAGGGGGNFRGRGRGAIIASSPPCSMDSLLAVEKQACRRCTCGSEPLGKVPSPPPAASVRPSVALTASLDGGYDGASSPVDAHSATTLFDRVLVDAECTHDGSLKHVDKFRTTWGMDTLVRRTAGKRLQSSLETLQRGLLASGFRLLAPGGTLVYATCSLTVTQNEDVVAWLLETQPAAVLLPIVALPDRWRPQGHQPLRGPHAMERASDIDDGHAVGTAVAPPLPSVLSTDVGAASLKDRFFTLHTGFASASSGHGDIPAVDPPWEEGGLPGTKRFVPSRSGTGGMFIAKLTRRA